MTILRAISLAASSTLAVLPFELETSDFAWNGIALDYQPARLRDVMEETHAAARAERDLAPLEWDDRLTKDAARWAETLADRNAFGHDPQHERAERQGENLWMGTRGAFPESMMAKRWIQEQRDFRSGRFPNIARHGVNWEKVGHYTQIIWPATRRFGCAIASNRNYDFLVCRYYPAGNVVGETL